MPGGLRQSCGSGSEDAVTIHVRVRAERSPGEKRVAATPDSIKKLLAAGATVDVESGAGSGSLITDAASGRSASSPRQRSPGRCSTSAR